MAAPKIGTKYVPSDGPMDTDIVLVGEAPGVEEEKQGRPFAVPPSPRYTNAGMILDRYLERHGRSRDEVFVTNLARYRPKGNKFKHLVDSPQLEEGLSELALEIQKIKPNIIIALGAWPLYYLTGKCGTKNNKPVPGTGILNYRGSFLQALPHFGGGKVFATIHPAFLLRAWSYNPILHYDLGRAIKDAEFPELRHPTYESYINPDRDDLRAFVEEAKKSEWVSVDIETFPNGTFSCIGFTYDEKIGVTVTFERPDLHHMLREMWESDAPKIFQFGTYDISFMNYFYGWNIGGYYGGRGWDTYVAAASIMPSFPRGLDFLTSIYTRFPYYKDERKVWKEENDMTILWEYNIKDIIATYQIAQAQMEELDER